MTWEFIWAWIWLHKSDDLTVTTNNCTVIFVAAAMEHLEEQALEFYSAEHSEKLKILKKQKTKTEWIMVACKDEIWPNSM